MSRKRVKKWNAEEVKETNMSASRCEVLWIGTNSDERKEMKSHHAEMNKNKEKIGTDKRERKVKTENSIIRKKEILSQ